MKNSENRSRRPDHCGSTSRLQFAAAAICVFTLISVATASADNSSHRPIAFTESGLVIGSTTDGVKSNFSASPTQLRRWARCAGGRRSADGFFPGFVLQATQFGSECTQAPEGGSENCLFLNVFTPQSEIG